jgi:hypothetical protein
MHHWGVGGGGALVVKGHWQWRRRLCQRLRFARLALLGSRCSAQLTLLGVCCSARTDVLQRFCGVVVGSATPALQRVRESGGRSAAALLGWQCWAGIGGVARKGAAAVATVAPAATKDVPWHCWGGGGGAALMGCWRIAIDTLSTLGSLFSSIPPYHVFRDSRR